jgi:hypothetical protein
VDIIDMVYNEKAQQIEIVGFGNPPVGDVEIVRRDSKSFWEILNFMPTIGDLRNFWRMKVPKEKPYLYLRGEAGFPFRQEIYFKDLPKSSDRAYLLPTTKTATFRKETLVKGVRADPKIKVGSRQKEAHSTGPNTFEWTFLAPKSGDYNHANLLLKTPDREKPWRAYYELFRGYPGEVSARFTGVVGTDLSVMILGEAYTQYWFEDIFGWDHNWLADRRWGVAAKYFQSLASFNTSADSQEVDFSVTNLDIKYRLNSGVWGRDPTVGLISGYQNVTFVGYNVQMFGGGVFWARSMPKIFDSIFNLLPFMRYPKWVDMEALWYPTSLSSDQTINATFALNFHGKVQWSKQWFGEAGFGLKNFNWTDNVKERQLAFGLAYSTIGLGYQF